MKKRWVLLLLVLILFLCLLQSPAHGEAWPASREGADSLAELHTIVPEGVTEIDLRAILGDDAQGVEEAWMLNADICVILRAPPEDGDYELILLDTQNCAILSRTPVPYAEYLSGQGWDDDKFYLLFEPEGSNLYDHEYYYTYDLEITYIKAIVTPDGTVDIDDSVPDRFTVMPGGKTAVRTADDGSLYAVDLATEEEELLIQGIPAALWQPNTPEELLTEAAFEAYVEYVPCWDELEDWDHEEDIQFFQTREFYVSKSLDEHRFVYAVHSWEWNSGYGIYDLQTRTDHRITGRGDFFGVVGDTLFGETMKADVNTYESSLLPESVREQFEAASRWDTDALVCCDISPGGKLLALTGMIARSIEEKSWWDAKGIEPKFDYAHTVTITDINTGEIVRTYDIDNPFAEESSVAFYGDTHVMLFCRAKENGSAYIYLFNVEE